MKQLASANDEPRRPGRRAARGGGGERVYDYLRELIICGRLAPGSRIVESDIAINLGVSRTPIQSALRRLVHEGYIVANRRRKEARLVIAPLTQDDARELFNMVGVVEGLAASEAAQRTPEDREVIAGDLTALNAELAAVVRSGIDTARRLFDLDMRFHRRYVESGAGPRLLALHDSIKPQAERYVRLYTNSLLGEMGRSVEEHEVIIARIASGNADGARRAVQRNWRNAAARIDQLIATKGERGTW